MSSALNPKKILLVLKQCKYLGPNWLHSFTSLYLPKSNLWLLKSQGFALQTNILLSCTMAFVTLALDNI